MLSVLDNNKQVMQKLTQTHLTCMTGQYRLNWHACTLELEFGDACQVVRFKQCNTDHMVVGTGNQAPLRASISVKTLMMPPYDSPAPILQGQTQAEADESGVMRIDDMILSAIPGDYALAVTLPDYPQVMGSTK